MDESVESPRMPDQIPGTLVNDRFDARVRGFGPIGILAILIILAGNFIITPLSAILVLVWTKYPIHLGARLVMSVHAVGSERLWLGSFSALR
jgi:hypothetical protein